MSQWLIKLDDGEPMSHYMAAQSHGAQFSWTPQIHAAQKFTSREEAEMFVGKRMPTMQVQVVPLGAYGR